MEGRHFTTEEREVLLQLRAAINAGVAFDGSRIDPNRRLFEDEIYHGLHIDDVAPDFSDFLYDFTRRTARGRTFYDRAGSDGLARLATAGVERVPSDTLRPPLPVLNDRRTFPFPPAGDQGTFGR